MEYNKYLEGFGKRRTIVYCWWGYMIVQLFWKIVWPFLEKTELPMIL
jgi:hypothetical protein